VCADVKAGKSSVIEEAQEKLPLRRGWLDVGLPHAILCPGDRLLPVFVVFDSAMMERGEGGQKRRRPGRRGLSRSEHTDERPWW
jgi:hypothetical protein